MNIVDIADVVEIVLMILMLVSVVFMFRKEEKPKNGIAAKMENDNELKATSRSEEHTSELQSLQ